MVSLNSLTTARRDAGWTRRRLLGAAAGSATLLGVASLAGCAAPPAPAPSPTTGPAGSRADASSQGQVRRGGTLRIAFPGAAQKLDPAVMTLNEEYNVTLAIYSNLVRVDAGLRPQPELATSWQPSDDLKTWSFQLRQGVRFHHGKSLDADDVVHTFRRLLDPANASAARSILSFVEGVEKTGSHAVAFHLKQANADLPAILGFAQGRILPADRSDEQIRKEPSGTGPFRLKELAVGERVSLVRNPDYWEPGLPYLGEVRHVTMPEQATRVAALTGGTIDLIWQINPEEMPSLRADPAVEVLQVESGGYQPLVMRSDRPPFDDPRLRLALKHVVDRDQMRKAVLLGLGSLGTDHPIPPISPMFADLGIRRRDVEKARQLLREAGYPDGVDLTLHTTAGRPGLVEQAVAFKEMAAPAGIRVDVQKVPNNVFWADYWMKKDFIVSNWNFRPTADETFSVAYHSEAKWNEAHWQSPQLDELIVQARGEGQAARRQQLYAQAARLLMDEGPVVVAFFRPMLSAKRKLVQSFQVHPATWLDVRAAWLAV